MRNKRITNIDKTEPLIIGNPYENLKEIVNGTIEEVEEALRKFNVPVRDENGDFRSTYDVLQDLSDKWKIYTK